MIWLQVLGGILLLASFLLPLRWMLAAWAVLAAIMYYVRTYHPEYWAQFFTG